jgi:D-3-phosphoglycerate dehydrogenase / 2-oxoglutarate reductase
MPATPRPIIFLAEPIAAPPLDWLNERAAVVDATKLDREALLDRLKDAQALLVRTYTIVDDALLDAAPNLRVVARAGVGLDNIDLDACHDRGITVVHTPSANTGAVVEYVTAMMLNALRPIAPLDDCPIADRWHSLREHAITPRSCVGARLGIVGLGKIGTKLARVAGALSMDTVYTDLRTIDNPPPNARAVSLSEIAASSDIVSIHVDGRTSNHHLIDADFFNALKPDAIFINTARGFVVDPNAAADFATANPGATLILDVHDPEPIAPDSPLFDLPNIVLTPHIAAATSSAKEAMSWVVRDLLAALDADPNP